MIAFIQISITDHTKKALDGFTQIVSTYPEVIECHHITGDHDFLLKILVDTIEEYNDFLNDKLSTLPYIGKTQSTFSLSQTKDVSNVKIDLNSIPDEL